MKRSANSGDFKKAQNRIEELGYVEGNPKSILKKLGFDGSWKEFVDGIGVPVGKTDVGRYAVSLCQDNAQEDSITSQETLTTVDPDIYASCAFNFLLGQGDPRDFEDYVGIYNEIHVMNEALASNIDCSIGGLWLPLNTNEDIEVYTIDEADRSLMYTAPGDYTFRLYGTEILARV